MRYHAPTAQFTLDEAALKLTSLYLRQAIRHIRKVAGLPMTPYRHTGALDSPQFAEAEILEAAQTIGIDMGARRPGQLDVSEPDDAADLTPQISDAGTASA